GSVKCAANRIEIVLQLVAREWLDDHPGAILLEPAVHVRRSARGVAHVVQTIEERHEVVVLARKRFRAGYFELDAVPYACIARALFGGFDRFVVVIESGKLGFGIGLGHQNRRCAQTTAYVGDPRSAFQFFIYALERRNPRSDEICSIARPKKSFRAHKQFGVMLMPTHSLAGLESLGKCV